MHAKFCFFPPPLVQHEKENDLEDEWAAAKLLQNLQLQHPPKQHKRKLDALCSPSESGMFTPKSRTTTPKIPHQLREALTVVRGNSTATENCLYLAEEMLRYFSTGKFPTTQACEELVSEFHLSLFLRENNAHLKSSTPITEKTTAKMTPVESFWAGAKSANPSNIDDSLRTQHRFPPLPGTIDLATSHISKIRQELIDHANQQQSKRICGALFFWTTAPASTEITERKGHAIAFYVVHQEVWFVDAQSIMDGVEDSNTPALFHHLENQYPFIGSDNSDFDSEPFSPYVFYALLQAAELQNAPQGLNTLPANRLRM